MIERSVLYPPAVAAPPRIAATPSRRAHSTGADSASHLRPSRRRAQKQGLRPAFCRLTPSGSCAILVHMHGDVAVMRVEIHSEVRMSRAASSPDPVALPAGGRRGCPAPSLYALFAVSVAHGSLDPRLRRYI